MQSPVDGPLLSTGAVFTLLVVMLGPVKTLGPFAQLTHDIDDRTARQIAVRAFLLSLVTVVLGSFLGVALLRNWQVSLPALELAGGLLFLIVGLRIVLEQYQPVHQPPAPLPAQPMAAAIRLAFPAVVTPYGIAAVIVLLANSADRARTATIVGLVVAVMLLNLLTMVYARALMGTVTMLILRILGAVLGVLQVGLAVQFILHALRTGGLIHG